MGTIVIDTKHMQSHEISDLARRINGICEKDFPGENPDIIALNGGQSVWANTPEPATNKK